MSLWRYGLVSSFLRVIYRAQFQIIIYVPLFLSFATGASAPPFHSDKTNLLTYINEEGHEEPVETANDWKQRREHILASMALVMGSLPEDNRKVKLDLQIMATEELTSVTRKKVSYTSEFGHRVPAYLLIPNHLQGKAPAMLCLHGTGGAMGRTAGLGADYPRYALELAERGYITIAPDCPLFGENSFDLINKGYVSGSMKAIWDHMRAVDLLLSLPEVDSERIGCIGHSLGGHNALFVGVFDKRIKLIVTSAGFDSFADYAGGDLTAWCQLNYMPKIESVYGKDPRRLPFDFPEVLAALAPRALYIHAPLNDANFQIESVQRCVLMAMSVYRLLGAEARIMTDYPSGQHGFPPDARERAYMFIDDMLGEQDSSREPL